MPRITVHATLRAEDKELIESWRLGEDFTIGSILHTIRKRYPEYSVAILSLDLEKESDNEATV